METAETKTNDSLTAIVFAVFAVACLGAFLFYRGSDLGHLPNLVGNLGGGPLSGSEFVYSAVGALVAILIVQSWFGLGSFVLGFFVINDLERMRGTIATGLGLVIWSSAWFF